MKDISDAVKAVEDILFIDQFQEWLMKKDGEEIVGAPGEEDCCPLAIYLKLTVSCRVEVGGECIEVFLGEQSRNIPNPDWVSNFLTLPPLKGDGILDSSSPLTIVGYPSMPEVGLSTSFHFISEVRFAMP